MPSSYSYVNERELRHMLELAILDLQKKGLLPQSVDKENLIEGVIYSIKNENKGEIPELSLNGFDNRAFASALFVMLICEHTNQTLSPQNKLTFNYALLFRDIPSLTPDQKKEFKEELKNEIKKRLIVMNQHSPQPSTPTQIDQYADELADAMMRNAKGELIKDEGAMHALLTLELSVQELNYQSLFGGISRPGAVQAVIQTLPGNIAAFANISLGYYTSMSSMDEMNRVDSNKYDYQGTERFTLINMLGNTIIDTLIEQRMLQPSAPTLTRQ